MIALTLAEVAAATDGRLSPGTDPQAVVTGPVVADSRTVTPGALFVALAGERTDGHDHAAAAVADGAVAVLAGRDLPVPAVVVEDPLTALGRLTRAVIDRLPELTVVGVTGSSGKTSTKDLLAAVLSAAGPTVAPVGSFNNELGLPLTALRCDPGTRFLVAEMGARGPGHIRYLCGITPPRIGVVLNVGAAHAGVFGSIAATAAAKGELPAALGAGGVAVLNADDPAVRRMAVGAGARTVLFGESGSAQVRALDVRLDPMARPTFRLVTPDGEAEVSLQLHGEHHVSNALAAAAVGLAAGLDLDQVAGRLGAATAASRWRMEVTARPDGVVVVNDAYNANPDSVRAALKALVAMGRGGDGREGARTWAVLGEMAELGDTADTEHDAIGRLAVRLDVSHLVAVGEGPPRMTHQGAAQEGSWADEAAWVPDPDAAFELLAPRLRPGDVVLVKASRSVGLDALAARLLAGEGVA